MRTVHMAHTISLALAAMLLGPLVAGAQTPPKPPPAVPHLGAPTQFIQEQRWSCSGRSISLRLEGDWRTPVVVTAYAVGDRHASKEELAAWNRELASIFDVVSVVPLCDARLEAIAIEGTGVSPDKKLLKKTVVASGGGGKIGGYSHFDYWYYHGSGA